MAWGYNSNSGGGGGGGTFTTISSETSTGALSTSDAGKLINNSGASGTVVLTLPDANDALTLAPYAFSVAADQILRIVPATGDYIQMGPYRTGTGTSGSVECGVFGGFITLKAVSAGVWQAMEYSHPWDVDGIVFTKSWLFNSDADYAENNSMTTPNFFASGGTLAMWIRTVETKASGDVLMSYTDEGSSLGFYLLQQTFTDLNSYQLLFNPFFSTSGARWQNEENSAVERGQWTHIAITYDASDTANNAQIYVNGDAISTEEAVAPSGTYSPSVQGIVIGNNAAHNGSAGCWFAQVAAWTDILTPNEIQFTYAGAKQVLMGSVNRGACYMNYTFGNHASDDITSTLTNAIGAAEALTVTGMTAAEEYTDVP